MNTTRVPGLMAAPVVSLLLGFLLGMAAGCSTPHVFDEQLRQGALIAGLSHDPPLFHLETTRYWSAQREGNRLVVENSELGTGVSPVWMNRTLPDHFEVVLAGRLVKEGLDGGWGLEFGAVDRRYAYRVLVYASGRFCIDRVFDRYPEFIHCVPREPAVIMGESLNVLLVRVVGNRITVQVNGKDVVDFRDDRYRPGEFALAVGGAGAAVQFEDMVVLEVLP